jgi:phosphate starvation-inducible PhoH-like protein
MRFLSSIFIAPALCFINNPPINKPYILMSAKSKVDFECLYYPKNENQHLYKTRLEDDNTNLVVGVGPAGTGKSLFPCQEAVRQLKNKKKIVITRPVKSVDEELGYLPGGLIDKMDPWIRPLIEIFSEYYPISTVQAMMNDRRIEVVPLAFMRGRTFKNTFIIADEMQNATPEQIFMLLTRLGKDSKMCLTGDIKQCDIEEDGLKNLIKNLHKYYVTDKKGNITIDGIQLVEFKQSDIMRHKFVSKIIDIYDNQNDNSSSLGQ